MSSRRGNMRKRIVTAFAILALCAAVASMIGCAAEQATSVNIATATTGGAYYPIGNALAQIWGKNLKNVRASAQSTAGTPQNIELMQNQEVQIAFGQNGICYYAFNAKGTYEGKTPYKEMRGMFTLYPNVMHWIVRKNAGIKSLGDFKGKKFVPGQVASATEINSREMMEAYGLNYMKDKGATNVSAEFLGYNEAADQLKNNQTDGIHIAGGVPTSSVMDVLSSGMAELISLEDDKIQEIVKKYPWYFPFTIPAGTYPNQDKEIKTLALANILFTDARQKDDVIYKLTKATFEYHNDLVMAHKATEYTVLENALNGMTIPLHNGSIKYFKEKGIKIPDELIVK
jgi:TRAP transporter TAXI family solute receptor